MKPTFVAVHMSDLVSLSARALGKWTLYLSFDWEASDLIEAAPILASGLEDPDAVAFMDGWALFGFDTEEDARAAFASTVGDDGPTPSNPYNGPTRVYALLANPDGRLLTENT
jgi:hypothetical protein